MVSCSEGGQPLLLMHISISQSSIFFQESEKKSDVATWRCSAKNVFFFPGLHIVNIG